jgi:hypothetical protein
MDTPKELKARYPYMWQGNNIGISFSKGWFKTFAQLCADIDALLGQDKRGFHYSQVKEKFGTIRIYWGLGKMRGPTIIDIQTPEGLTSLVNDPAARVTDEKRQELMSKIQQLVSEAEEMTTNLCAVCGAKGEMDRGTGYYLVLCPHHIAQRKMNPRGMDSPWFGQADE